MTNKEVSLDSWNDFNGTNFLKSQNVSGENEGFYVIDVNVFRDLDNPPKPRLTLEKHGKKFFFDMNITNCNICEEKGIASPKNLIGKILYFKKIYVISPKTKKEVESLRILKIEDRR